MANDLTALHRRFSIAQISWTSAAKRKQYLEDNMPNDETISAWCADLTEDLTGEVGTVEIPGETAFVQIQPGYEANAVYNIPRDGQLLPTVIASAAQSFYNLAMMPGWQRWMPLFRYGTITAIDGDTASVDVEGITSSQQALEINQTDSLSDVAIEYMNCNGGAFEVDDEVLLKFTGQAWDSPVIVGFKDNPKMCGIYLIITSGTEFIVWDLKENTYSEGIMNNAGVEITSFPYSKSLASDFLDSLTHSGTGLNITANRLTYLVPTWNKDTDTESYELCYVSGIDDPIGDIVTTVRTYSYQIPGVDETGSTGPFDCTKTSNIVYNQCTGGLVGGGTEFQPILRDISFTSVSPSYEVTYDGVVRGSPQSHSLVGESSSYFSGGYLVDEFYNEETYISKSPMDGRVISDFATILSNGVGEYQYNRKYMLIGELSMEERYEFTFLYEKEIIYKVQRNGTIYGPITAEITRHRFYTDNLITVEPFMNTVNDLLTAATDDLSEVSGAYIASA